MADSAPADRGGFRGGFGGRGRGRGRGGRGGKAVFGFCQRQQFFGETIFGKV